MQVIAANAANVLACVCVNQSIINTHTKRYYILLADLLSLSIYSKIKRTKQHVYVYICMTILR